MENNIEVNIPSITVADLEKLANRIKQATGSDETEVSFEMVIASFFPTSWSNIQKELNHQYTIGYIAGYNDRKEELKGRTSVDEDPDCYCE